MAGDRVPAQAGEEPLMTQLAVGKVRAEIDGDDGERHCALVGRLDEESPLRSLVPAIQARRVVLDTAGIDFINSIGVREWIHMLASLRRGGAQVTLIRASEPLTAQLSMLRATREACDIQSVHVPYECAGCLREENVLIEIGPNRSALLAMRPPVLPCPECGGRFELADLPERYFLFVRDAASGA
jgi:anti-anti-sigma regulatory factor